MKRLTIEKVLIDDLNLTLEGDLSVVISSLQCRLDDSKLLGYSSVSIITDHRYDNESIYKLVGVRDETDEEMKARGKAKREKNKAIKESEVKNLQAKAKKLGFQLVEKK